MAGLFFIKDEEIECIQRESKAKNFRFCAIRTFPSNSIALETPTPNRIHLHHNNRPTSTNEHPTSLLLWETNDMNPIDISTLEIELFNATEKSQTNPQYTSVPKITIPWTYTSKNYTRSATRYSPFKFPTLLFLKKSPKFLPTEDNPSSLETHNQIAAALGILPREFSKHLDYHNHNWDRDYAGPVKDTLARISNHIRTTTTEAYALYLKWQRRDQYADYG